MALEVRYIKWNEEKKEKGGSQYKGQSITWKDYIKGWSIYDTKLRKYLTRKDIPQAVSDAEYLLLENIVIFKHKANARNVLRYLNRLKEQKTFKLSST